MNLGYGFAMYYVLLALNFVFYSFNRGGILNTRAMLIDIDVFLSAEGSIF